MTPQHRVSAALCLLVCLVATLPFAQAMPRPFWTTMPFQDGFLAIDCDESGLSLQCVYEPFLTKHPTWCPAGTAGDGAPHRPPSGFLALGGILRVYAIRPDGTVIPHAFGQVRSVERKAYAVKLVFDPIESVERTLEIAAVPTQSVLIFHYKSEGLADYKLRLSIDGLPGILDYPDPIHGGRHSFGEGFWVCNAEDEYLLHRFGAPLEGAGGVQLNPTGALFLILQANGAGLLDSRLAPSLHRRYEVHDLPWTQGPRKSGESTFLVEFAVQPSDSLEFGLAFADSPDELVKMLKVYRPVSEMLQPEPFKAGTVPTERDWARKIMEKAQTMQFSGAPEWIHYTGGFWAGFITETQRAISSDANLRTNFATRMKPEELNLFVGCITELEARRLSNGVLRPSGADRRRPCLSPPPDVRAQTPTVVTLARMGLADSFLLPYARTLAASARQEAGPPIVTLNDRDLEELLASRNALLAAWPSHVPISASSVRRLAKWVSDGGRLTLVGGCRQFLPIPEQSGAASAIQSPQDVLFEALQAGVAPSSARALDEAARLGRGCDATADLQVVAAASSAAGPRGAANCDLSQHFATNQNVYLVIEHDDGAPEVPAVLREVVVTADVEGASSVTRWQPNTTEEERFLAADVGSAVVSDATGGRAVRYLGPGAFVAYRIRGERGATVRAVVGVTGPYRIRVGAMAPEAQVPVVGTDEEEKEQLRLARHWNPVLFRPTTAQVRARILGHEGALAFTQPAGRGRLSVIGLPPDAFAWDPAAAQIAAMVLEKDDQKDLLTAPRQVWHDAIGDGVWDRGVPREPAPAAAAYAIWALHEAWKRSGDSAFCDAARVRQMAQAAEAVRYGSAYDPVTGLFGDSLLGGVPLPQTELRSPEGKCILLLESLELNAVWHVAFLQLAEMAVAARDRDAERFSKREAERLKTALRGQLWQKGLETYLPGIVRTVDGGYEPCPLDWEPLRESMALVLALLGPQAPWSDKERTLMAGHLLAHGAENRPLACAALATLDLPRREELITRTMNSLYAETPLVEPLFPYTMVPALPHETPGISWFGGRKTRSPDSLHLALVIYALCRARADQ